VEADRADAISAPDDPSAAALVSSRTDP
jgi:hypothetical protein